MTNSDERPDTSTCGCCRSVEDDTTHINKPGQPAIRYRIGTHGTFLRRMIRRLPLQEVRDGYGPTRRPLAKLTTQETSDPSVALLDAFAVVADVLTFYQERIANESYLRTATERRSVLELAREIGYELNPGVTASTFLAFTVETAKGAPETVTIGQGTKVQSIPAPGKLPQTFETSEELVARPEWNALKPKTTIVQKLKSGTKEVYLQNVNLGLRPGDYLLFVGDERLNNPGSERWDVRQVTEVQACPKDGYTRVSWLEGLGGVRVGHHVDPATINPKIYVFRQRASLFGYNAPDWHLMSFDLKRTYLNLGEEKEVPLDITEWPGFSIHELRPHGFYGEYFSDTNLRNRKFVRTDPKVGFDWKNSSPDPGLSKKSFSIRWTGFMWMREEGDYTLQVTFSGNGLRLWIDGEQVADRWGTPVSDSISEPLTCENIDAYHEIKLEYCNDIQGNSRIWINVYLKSFDPIGGTASVGLADVIVVTPSPVIILDTIYSSIIPETWCALSVPDYIELYRIKDVAEDSRTGFALTAKTTRLTIEGENLLEIFDKKIRETVVLLGAEEIKAAEKPDATDITGQEIVVVGCVKGLTAGKTLVISGLSPVDGTPVCETAVLLKDSVPGDSTTTLTFTVPLKKTYRRDSVTIFANVVPATHGETVKEILGSGDAGLAYQQFTLKKPPLTYVPAPTTSGGESTLSVRIDGLEWTESPTLYGKDGTSEHYVVRIGDDAKAEILFGDGIEGARLTTGTENVTAVYRSGTGPDGEVAGGTLTLLPVRPIGIREVTNPAAATGGAAPEDRDDARNNAPLKVRTLDRIVSLRDYEDFSRAYTGIAKARADPVWSGEELIVLITVLGPGGKTIDEGTEAQPGPLEHLRDAITAWQDPGQLVRIKSAVTLFFDVHVSVLFDIPRYREEAVRSGIRDALEEAFSFEKMEFGQNVFESDLMAVIQQVPGVLAASIDQFTIIPDCTSSHHRFPAIMKERALYRRYLPVKPAVFSKLQNTGIERISGSEILFICPDRITISRWEP